MEKSVKFDAIQPRFLRYRSHFKIYLFLLIGLSALVLSFWGYQFFHQSWVEIKSEYSYELWISLAFFVLFASFHFLWLRHRLSRAVQVYADHIVIHNLGKKEEVLFCDVESVGIVCWSVFYFKMKSGTKHFFSSSLERVDYIWEGFHAARPDLISDDEFAAFRTKLIQYDHHQKRKEWFFRHKLIDVFNWFIMPFVFLAVTYVVQSRHLVINQQGMYFFRLFMYATLVLMVTTFLYSIILKKFIFDKRVLLKLNTQPDDKLRDIEFEAIVLHRSKIMQVFTACFLFALIVRVDINMFSLTKVREDVSQFNIKSGKTLIVDNRYNCTQCKFPVKDGDIVVFGRGTVGQIMATGGDMVGQISQDTTGRIIASENIQEVPQGHVAIKMPHGREIVMVKVQELIGKIQK